MAYTMTHIYIAEKVAERLGDIRDYPTYILGTIAPDAVHADDNYVVADKERSHLFTEGLHWGKISNVTQVDAWVGSIRRFYKVNKDKYNHDFLLGYIVHLYADVYNSMQFYYPYICSIGGNLNNENREHFLKENYGYNYYLYLAYSKNHNLKEMLESAKAETIDGVVSKEVIEKRIEQLYEYEFAERDISDIDEYTICSQKVMDKLICDGSVYVLDELKLLGTEYAG